MTALYHYTCQHGRDGIGDQGQLLTPGRIKSAHRQGPLPGIYAELDDLIWLTDLEVPHRDGLGLRNALGQCDRTSYRYQALDTTNTQHYVTVRRTFNPTLVRLLESATGAMPMHWWVSTQPVPVLAAPITRGAA